LQSLPNTYSAAKARLERKKERKKETALLVLKFDDISRLPLLFIMTEAAFRVPRNGANMSSISMTGKLPHLVNKNRIDGDLHQISTEIPAEIVV
jgi:hypothetical protein